MGQMLENGGYEWVNKRIMRLVINVRVFSSLPPASQRRLMALLPGADVMRAQNSLRLASGIFK